MGNNTSIPNEELNRNITKYLGYKSPRINNNNNNSNNNNNNNHNISNILSSSLATKKFFQLINEKYKKPKTIEQASLINSYPEKHSLKFLNSINSIITKVLDKTTYQTSSPNIFNTCFTHNTVSLVSNLRSMKTGFIEDEIIFNRNFNKYVSLAPEHYYYSSQLKYLSKYYSCSIGSMNMSKENFDYFNASRLDLSCLNNLTSGYYGNKSILDNSVISCNDLVTGGLKNSLNNFNNINPITTKDSRVHFNLNNNNNNSFSNANNANKSFNCLKDLGPKKFSGGLLKDNEKLIKEEEVESRNEDDSKDYQMQLNKTTVIGNKRNLRLEQNKEEEDDRQLIFIPLEEYNKQQKEKELNKSRSKSKTKSHNINNNNINNNNNTSGLNNESNILNHTYTQVNPYTKKSKKMSLKKEENNNNNSKIASNTESNINTNSNTHRSNKTPDKIFIKNNTSRNNNNNNNNNNASNLNKKIPTGINSNRNNNNNINNTNNMNNNNNNSFLNSKKRNVSNTPDKKKNQATIKVKVKEIIKEEVYYQHYNKDKLRNKTPDITSRSRTNTTITNNTYINNNNYNNYNTNYYNTHLGFENDDNNNINDESSVDINIGNKNNKTFINQELYFKKKKLGDFKITNEKLTPLKLKDLPQNTSFIDMIDVLTVNKIPKSRSKLPEKTMTIIIKEQ